MKKIALSLFVIAASGAYVMERSGTEPSNDVLGAALPSDGAPTGSIAGRAADAVIGGQGAPARQTSAFVPQAPSQSAQDEGPASGTLVAVAGPREEPGVPPPQSPPLPEPFGNQPADDPGPAEAASDPPPVAPPSSALPPPAAPPPAALAVVDVPLPRPRPEYRATRVSATRVGATQAEVTAAAGTGYSDGTFTGPSVDAYYGFVQVQAIVQGGRLAGIKVLRYPSDRRTSIYINRQALPMLRDEVIRAQSAKVDIISGATLTSRAFMRSLDAALRQATA